MHPSLFLTQTIIMKQYFYLFLLVAFASCSSGLSDSEALKIANNTPKFKTVECGFMRINSVMAATPTSKYLIQGVQMPMRSSSDEAIHHHSLDSFFPIKEPDADGKVINLAGNPIMASWKGILTGVCNGCEYCYTQLQNKNIVKFEVTEKEPDDMGFIRGKVTLTEEGKKYLINWSTPEGANRVCTTLNSNTGDAVALKLMERVYTGAKKIKEDENTAEFYLQYYLDLTPYGEVLLGDIPREPGFQSKAVFKKDLETNEWSLQSLKDLRKDSQVREF